jgi:hypothetical protein
VLFRDDAPRLMTPGTFVAAAWDDAADHMAAIADAGEWWELVVVDAAGRHLAGRLGKDTFHPAAMGAADISPDGSLAAFTGTDKLGRGTVFVGSAAAARDGALGAFRQLSGVHAVRWVGNGAVLTVNEGGLSLLDPDAAFTASAVADGSFDDARWDGNGIVAVRREDGRATLMRSRGALLALEPVLGLPGTNTYAVIAARKSQALVRDTGNGEGLLIDLATTEQRRLDATSAEWGVGAAEGKLLACTAVEVAVVDLTTGNRQVVTRQGGALSDCHWHPSGSYIFYRAGATAYVIENDTRDVPVRYALFSGTSLAGFSATPSRASL